uniref:ETS domain-containing protein n=1 Tax=Eptatretus burgeri TaxID=7764 RepID=A0A8C4QUT5_EPTBU
NVQTQQHIPIRDGPEVHVWGHVEQGCSLLQPSGIGLLNEDDWIQAPEWTLPEGPVILSSLPSGDQCHDPKLACLPPPYDPSTPASAALKSKPSRPAYKRQQPLLWEFIRDLLLEPEGPHRPLCWLDHRLGVFRVVSSTELARLWGYKKGNLKMNYEKLSRAMRHYYRKNILVRVDGRRLVFQFGSKATGWQPTLT